MGKQAEDGLILIELDQDDKGTIHWWQSSGPGMGMTLCGKTLDQLDPAFAVAYEESDGNLERDTPEPRLAVEDACPACFRLAADMSEDRREEARHDR